MPHEFSTQKPGMCILKVLPHVKKAGYTSIQLMGIQEHAEYSSVGYKVTPYGQDSCFICIVSYFMEQNLTFRFYNRSCNNLDFSSHHQEYGSDWYCIYSYFMFVCRLQTFLLSVADLELLKISKDLLTLLMVSVSHSLT